MSYLARFTAFAALTLTFLSCSATNRLSMTVTEPAAVGLAPEIRRVGIINRAQPSESNKGIAKLDAILSAEGLKLDSLGAEAAITGLADRLRLSNRFEAVVVLDHIPGAAKGLKTLPASLTRDQVREICDQYGLDALFALSFYDTDTHVNLELGMMDVANEIGIPISVPAHRLQLDTELRNGWRIYHPGLPLPIDEMVYRDHFRVSAQGINPVEALQSIASRKEQILEISMRTGYNQAGRIEASRVRVGREYFVRGSDLFVRGKRLAQTGDWDAAASLWERETTHPKDKVAGRAYYNMAIINEINGDLESAIQWARDSYATFGTREALQYIRVLEVRQSHQAQLTADLGR